MNGADAIMRIPADVSRLASVRQFIRDQATRAGADREAMDDMVQAVDESVCNAIVHGYRSAGGSIEVEFGVVDGSLVVRLRDQAPPFDPTTVPTVDITVPLELRPAGGLGVHLTRELTDSMSYRHTSTGNELTLRRKLVTAGGARDEDHDRT